MANYYATTKTNYFRVTDETRYRELFQNLCAEDEIHDFTKEKDGILYHGFGCFGSINWYSDPDDEDADYNFDFFISELQKILPDDEAFIMFEVGNEKLRYVTGYALVVTSETARDMTLDLWAETAASELLGDGFQTQTKY